MVKVYRIKKRDKVRITLPLSKEQGEPYNEHTIDIFNKVFRRAVPVLGRCNWGNVQVLCWGFQYHELIEKLVRAEKANFIEDEISVEILDRWPRYPINATGDEDLIGVDDLFSYPNKIADERSELQRLQKRVKALKETIKLLTGEN